MNIIKEHVDYLKDNPNKYWFKRKLYGFGWTPARWQGWLVTLLYIVFITTFIIIREEPIPGNPDSGSNLLVFGLPLIVLTAIFIFIAYKKGEKPRWQWGRKK